MKPHLLKVKEAEGFDAYLVAIKNFVAGCKQKWKLMPKDYMLIVIGVTLLTTITFELHEADMVILVRNVTN